MNLRRLVFAVLLLGADSASGQTPSPVFQVDLQSHGWQADRELENGSALPYIIDFADDDSLWVAFPTETSKPLQSRDKASESQGKVLHVGPSGEVVRGCDIGTQRWNVLRLFARPSDGFTLEMADRLVAYDARCEQHATYPTDRRVGFVPSLDRAHLYTRTKDNHVFVLNANDLTVAKKLDLPSNVGPGDILFGNQVIVFSVRVPMKGCWQSNLSRMGISSGEVSPWENIECAGFNLLGDGHVVYSNAKRDSPLEITGDTGVPTGKYTPPRDNYLDRAVLESTPVESSQSLRIVEELIEAKGRHPSLDLSGKFTGRDIVLLDMHSGVSLLTIKVPIATRNYAYALSRNGKNLAVLLSSQLSVYRLP